jgi:hypothetical protein
MLAIEEVRNEMATCWCSEEGGKCNVLTGLKTVAQLTREVKSDAIGSNVMQLHRTSTTEFTEFTSDTSSNH